MNGELQFFSIPIILGEQRKLCFRFRGNSLTYDYVDFYYFNIADRDDADLCHIRAGNVIGWGMNNPIVTSISLPPADEVPVGTDAFCTDLGMKVISDGTNWKKPDGTNLA